MRYFFFFLFYFSFQAVLASWACREFRRRRFAARKKIDLDQIYELFSVELKLNKSKVIKSWTMACKCLNMDPELLRPADRFSFELCCYYGNKDDDDLDDLAYSFYDMAEADNIEFDFSKLKTLGELIIIFSR